MPVLVSGVRSMKRLGVFFTTTGWDTSPPQVTSQHSVLSGCPQSNLPVPIYTPGRKEALWELSDLPKNTTWVHRTVQSSNARASNSKSDVLTTEPPRLPLNHPNGSGNDPATKQILFNPAHGLCKYFMNRNCSHVADIYLYI